MRPSARSAVLALAAALALPRAGSAQGASYEQMQTFSFLLSQIRLNYVVPVNTEQLVRAAIDGMLRSLDPHSRFVPRRQIERWAEWQAGHLAATGVILANEDGTVTVQAVLEGSPAARERILPGDRVLALNDTLVAGQRLEDVQLRLTGERGSRSGCASRAARSCSRRRSP